MDNEKDIIEVIEATTKPTRRKAVRKTKPTVIEPVVAEKTGATPEIDTTIYIELTKPLLDHIDVVMSEVFAPMFNSNPKRLEEVPLKREIFVAWRDKLVRLVEMLSIEANRKRSASEIDKRLRMAWTDELRDALARFKYDVTDQMDRTNPNFDNLPLKVRTYNNWRLGLDAFLKVLNPHVEKTISWR